MRFTCPCCGYKVFKEASGSYEICPICFWEDDIVQNENPFYAGGANEPSLYDAQQNYIRFGACEFRFIKNVREPRETDIKDENWKQCRVTTERKEKVIIDLSDIDSIESLHFRLKKALNFPENYGMNWDDFWQNITGAVEMPRNIEFRGWYEFELRLFKESRILKSLLDEMCELYPQISSSINYYT